MLPCSTRELNGDGLPLHPPGVPPPAPPAPGTPLPAAPAGPAAAPGGTTSCVWRKVTCVSASSSGDGQQQAAGMLAARGQVHIGCARMHMLRVWHKQLALLSAPPTCSALKRPARERSSPRSASASRSRSACTRASSAASAALLPRRSWTAVCAAAACALARWPSSARAPLPPASRKLRGSVWLPEASVAPAVWGRSAGAAVTACTAGMVPPLPLTRDVPAMRCMTERHLLLGGRLRPGHPQAAAAAPRCDGGGLGPHPASCGSAGCAR